MEKLKDSVCFQISQVPAKRKAQFDSNANLVSASNGSLAPLTVAEKYLSVSSSHVTAFVKAVLSNSCSTEQPDLAKLNNGKLSLDSLLATFPDPVFDSMAKEGWTWKVIAAEVEESLEWLPAWIQAGLNCNQQVASAASEMEQALSIAFWYEKSQSIKQAVHDTISGHPLACSYLECIAEWVAKYGGGDGFPLVKLVESISTMARTNARIFSFWLCQQTLYNGFPFLIACVLPRQAMGWLFGVGRRVYDSHCPHRLQIKDYHMSLHKDCLDLHPAH